MKPLLFLSILILGACGKSETKDPTQVFYGYKDNGASAIVSRITIEGGLTYIGRYQITQAEIQTSDNSILKSHSICGDVEILGVSAMAEVNGSMKSYDTFYGFYESAYIPDGATKIGHTKTNANASVIDSVLQGIGSCL